MQVAVPDGVLHALASSRARLQQRWPVGYMDVMVLLETLELGGATLEECARTGFVLIDPLPTAGECQVRHRAAVAVGMAETTEGRPVAAPARHPSRVARLTVHDLLVDGVSGRRRLA